jgi:hypothetical protein
MAASKETALPEIMGWIFKRKTIAKIRATAPNTMLYSRKAVSVTIARQG